MIFLSINSTTPIYLFCQPKVLAQTSVGFCSVLIGPGCQSRRLRWSRLSVSSWQRMWVAVSTPYPRACPRRCAAAPWARHGAPAVRGVPKMAQVSRMQEEESGVHFPIFDRWYAVWLVLIWSPVFPSLSSLPGPPASFSKICPAGKGYFLHSVRETVAFPPQIHTSLKQEHKQEGEYVTVAFPRCRWRLGMITFVCLPTDVLRSGVS